MRMRAAMVSVSACLALATAFGTATANASQGPELVGTVPGLAPVSVAHSLDMGAATGSKEVTLVLASRDDQGLNQFLATTNKPLSSAEYAQRFGPSDEAVQTATQWAQSQGLSVRYQAGSHLMRLSGDTTAVAKAFHTTLHSFRGNGQTEIASASQASIPANVAKYLDAVSGLAASHPLHTMISHVSKANAAGPQIQPSDLNSAYNVPRQNTGRGQQIAILAEGSMDATISNLQSFEQAHGLPQVRLTPVYPEGKPADDSQGDVEWALDTEYSTAMAPDVSGITVYAGTKLDEDSLTSATSAFVDANGIKTASMSIGSCESQESAWIAALDPVMKKADAQGQSIFIASGDSGSNCDTNGTFGVSYPASSPYAIAVGGTDLTSGQETAWASGGGGKSGAEPVPSFQTSAGGAFDGQHRGVPDVASCATSLEIYVFGFPLSVDGTSASAPTWNGFWARALSAKPGLGFAGPLLYSANRNAYHDITTGSNGSYSSGTGWDYTTGLGSPNVTNLIAAVAGR